MSMLSKQCKELRAEAERIGYWSPTASRLMFDAADILWSLRNKNVALLGENEKLRETVRFIMHQCNDGNPRCDECIGWNDGECVALLRMRELGIEVEQ